MLPVAATPPTSRHPLSLLRLSRHGLLLIAFALAFACRVYGVSAYGFSEDEVAKLRAIDAYKAGDFSANAEHPMLMKLLIWGSVEAAGAWNGRVAAPLTITPEAALRMPNVLAGAATVIAVYGAAMLLFGPAVAILAAFLIAFDPTIISINRIGKEDTLLMLFFLLAVWSYEYAKRVGAADPAGAQRWYTVAGACFGLMLASKYMPHLFGLYALYNVAIQRHAGRNVPDRRRYHAAMLAAFLPANFIVLLPETWSYAADYVRGGHSTHHGYLYDGQLYVNAATIVLWGVPWTYYLRLIVTKTPVPVLAGAAAGLWLLVARRRERGFVWLRVFLVIQMIGYAIVAAKFQRYALPLLIVVNMLAAAGLAGVGGWLRQRLGEAGRVSIGAAGACALVAISAASAWASAPFYSIHRNLLGAAQAPAVTVFPEEAYDYGVREAVHAIASVAAPGAAIVSDAPMVVEHYLSQLSRRDLSVRTLSQDGLHGRGEAWVLVQESHIYFENAGIVAQLRQSQRPWREYRLGGTVVLEIYAIRR
jgi:4-amino-4-deoxy-L-arabinose transferase-like glycosyltransferase